MPQIFGRNTFIYSGLESTWGTMVAGSVYTRVYSLSMIRSQQRDRKTDLSTSDGAWSKAHFDQFEEAGGTIEIPLQYDGIGLYLAAAMGDVTPSGGGPYIHTYAANTTDMGSLTIRCQRGSDTTEVFLGCMVSSMEISGSAGEEIKASFEFIAKTANTRSGTITPTYGDGKQAFHYEVSEMAVTPSGGGATVNYALQNFNFRVENAIERKNNLGSKLTAQPDINGFRTATLSCEAFMLDNTLYNLQLSGTPQDIIITMNQTGSSNWIKLYLYNAVITSFDDAIDTVGRLSQSFEFTGFADSSNEACKIVIENGDSSGVGN